MRCTHKIQFYQRLKDNARKKSKQYVFYMRRIENHQESRNTALLPFYRMAPQITLKTSNKLHKKLKCELTKSSSLHARMSFLRIFYCHQTIPFRIFVKIFFHKEVSLCVTIFQSSNHRLPPLTYKRIVTKSRFSITLVSLLKLFCAIT